MKFSIITVCRNNEATIARTIQSVNAQNYPIIQHVFVDGASTDKTVDLIRQQGTADKFLMSEPDAGIYDAMNKGILHAAGDIIGILNADDYFKNAGVLSRIADTFKNSDVDCVFGNVEYFRPESPDTIVRRYNSGRFSPRGLAIGIMPAHPATFFRRSVYERVGKFKTDYKISADFEFVVRAFKDGNLKYKYLDESFVLMQAGGVSSNGIKSKIILNREILRALRENGISSSYFHLAAKIPFRLSELIKRPNTTLQPL
jgi:glycosyltransferase involved in cell wall biosynthesis